MILFIANNRSVAQQIDIDEASLSSVHAVSGTWAFIWGKFVSPDAIAYGFQEPDPIDVPGSWVDTGHPDVGYGTYYVKLRLRRKALNHSILFRGISSSARIWINGKLAGELGRSDTDADRYQPKLSSLVATLPNDTLRIDLVIHVANFDYSRGGISVAPVIGPTSSLLHDLNNQSGLENLFIGSLIAMFVYHLTLFFSNRSVKAYLLLALICLAVVLRALVTYKGSQLLPELFPGVSATLWSKVEFFSVYAIVAIFPLYVYHLFPGQSCKKPIPFFAGLAILLCCLVVMAPHLIYSQMLNICHIALIAGFIYSTIVTSRAWKSGNTDARIILYGVLAAFPFVLLEIVQNSQMVHVDSATPYLVEIGVLLFLLFQVYLLANQSAVAFRNLEATNADLEAKVQFRTAALTKENFIRERLLSIVSHDIKSPLNSLRGALSIYQRGGFNDKEMKSVASGITENLDSTTLLVDNILLWASSQLKGIEVSNTSINLYELVEDQFQIFKLPAENKRIALINMAPRIHVFSDKQILSLILRNLIANAIKFCYESGTIKISVVRAESGFNLCVEDDGKGMDSHIITSLVMSKPTFSTDGTRNEKGTGLGLSLCMDYLRHIKGELSVRSELGKGSTFSVWVPGVGRQM